MIGSLPRFPFPTSAFESFFFVYLSFVRTSTVRLSSGKAFFGRTISFDFSDAVIFRGSDLSRIIFVFIKSRIHILGNPRFTFFKKLTTFTSRGWGFDTLLKCFFSPFAINDLFPWKIPVFHVPGVTISTRSELNSCFLRDETNNDPVTLFHKDFGNSRRIKWRWLEVYSIYPGLLQRIPRLHIWGGQHDQRTTCESSTLGYSRLFFFRPGNFLFEYI